MDGVTHSGLVCIQPLYLKFDLLEETMKENGLDGRHRQIFNMDEPGMPLDPESPKLIFEKGCHASSCVTTSDVQ